MPLVDLFSVPINHQVDVVPHDGLGLSIGATRFQKIDGCVCLKTLKCVFMVVAT